MYMYIHVHVQCTMYMYSVLLNLGDVQEVLGVGLGALVDVPALAAHEEQVVEEWVEPHTRP